MLSWIPRPGPSGIVIMPLMICNGSDNIGVLSLIEIVSILYSCLYGTPGVAATKCACATVLMVGWVLWHVIGIPIDSAIFAILIMVVNPGVLTMSG